MFSSILKSLCFDVFECCIILKNYYFQRYKYDDRTPIIITKSNGIVKSVAATKSIVKIEEKNINIKKCCLEPIKKIDNIESKNGLILKTSKLYPDQIGCINCHLCVFYSSSLVEYVEHTKNLHGIIYKMKDREIRICPICCQNYENWQFLKHIEDCTNSMRVCDKPINQFGCPHCKSVYEVSTSRKFRNHFMFCKSFEENRLDFNTILFKCKNCTFESTQYSTCLEHASFSCLYLQLNMKYASSPNEKYKVLKRSKLELECSSLPWKYNPPDFDSNSKIKCNKSRRLLFKCSDYFCFICNKIFYSKYLFHEHLNVKSDKCRKKRTWFCKKCVSDFESKTKYLAHRLKTQSFTKPNNTKMQIGFPTCKRVQFSIPKYTKILIEQKVTVHAKILNNLPIDQKVPIDLKIPIYTKMPIDESVDQKTLIHSKLPIYTKMPVDELVDQKPLIRTKIPFDQKKALFKYIPMHAKIPIDQKIPIYTKMPIDVSVDQKTLICSKVPFNQKKAFLKYVPIHPKIPILAKTPIRVKIPKHTKIPIRFLIEEKKPFTKSIPMTLSFHTTDAKIILKDSCGVGCIGNY